MAGEVDALLGPSATAPRRSHARWQLHSSASIIVAIAVLKFAMTLTTTMMMLPILRIMEDAVCHQVRGDRSPGMLPEELCKDEAVQTRLGYLSGYLQLSEGVISMLAAMPYGIVADRWGRRPAMLSSWMGLSLSFGFIMAFLFFGRDANLYFVLAGSVFQVFGGGLSVAFSAIYAVASDVTTGQERATSFFYLAIGATLGGISGPPLAGKIMMHYGPWIPILIVVVLTPFIFLLILLIPETLPPKASAESSAAPAGTLALAKRALAASIAEIGPSFQLVGDRNILLIMAVFFIQNPIYIAYSTVMVQFISKHFAWSIAQTSYLLTPLGIINIICLSGLPHVSRILTDPHGRFRLSAWRKDVLLTRTAIAIVIVGALIEGLTFSIVAFIVGLVIGTFGSSNNPLARAVATHYVPHDKTSRLMALIGIFETIGSFFGGPVLALCFDVSLQKGGLLIGLPYLYIAGLCSLALLAIMFLRKPPVHADSEDTDETEESDDLLSGP